MEIEEHEGSGSELSDFSNGVAEHLDDSVQATESPTFLVTDLLSSLGDKTNEPDYLVKRGNDLVILLEQYPYIKQDLVFASFGYRIQGLLMHPKKEVVAMGFRICRYIISDVSSIHSLFQMRIEMFIIVSLSKSSLFDIEREQAIKLIRKFLEIENGVDCLTIGLTNAIMSIAEQIDDKLRNISIETIAEISLMRPDLMNPANLIQFILDGPNELSIILLNCFVFQLDLPGNRKFIKKTDILKLISNFTEFPIKNHLNIEKLLNSSIIISILFKKWQGLYALCLNNFEPIRDLINCLLYPTPSFISIMLDLFLDILLIKSINRKVPTSNSKMILIPSKPENESIFSNQYRSILLLILIESGIIENLISIIKLNKDSNNVKKACFLLTEICNLTNNLLSKNYSNLILDKFNQKNDEIDEINRNNENNENNELNETNERDENLIFMIEKLSRKLNKGRYNFGLNKLKLNKNFKEISKKNRNKINYSVDDNKLKQMINDSLVLTTKSFTKWNCEILADLFLGPFLNGKRLEDVNKTTKFLKRLLSFFRPFKHKYSEIKKTKQSNRFTKLGCIIIETLLQSNEGLRILKDSKIVPQIAECLAQVDPYSGFVAKEQMFSKERLDTTLSSGYFKFIGILTKYDAGIELLNQWKVFSIMHHISDNPFKREDLIISFMNEIKFNKTGGQLRILLLKFLNSINLKIKLSSTILISKLINDEECNYFICELLVEQLYQQEEQIIEIIVSTLLKYCELNDKNLAKIVDLKPNILILKNFKNGVDLLLKFLTISKGFKYLNDFNFINSEINHWINGLGYIKYVIDVETCLNNNNSNKSPPINFFGELVKTEEGFNFIINSGLIIEFINFIRYYSINLNDENIDLLKLKACLYSIGFIGSSKYGIEILDINGCVEDISKIARNSPIISLRGCCINVLGLISKTSDGIEILDELEWETIFDIFNNSIGIIIPKSFNEIIEFNEDILNHEIKDKEVEIINNPIFHDERILEILKLIGNLCNHVYLNSSTKELSNIFKLNEDIFKIPELFLQTLKFFEVYKYKLTIRKFLINDIFLNDGRLLEILIKRDRRQTMLVYKS